VDNYNNTVTYLDNTSVTLKFSSQSALITILLHKKALFNADNQTVTFKTRITELLHELSKDNRSVTLKVEMGR